MKIRWYKGGKLDNFEDYTKDIGFKIGDVVKFKSEVIFYNSHSMNSFDDNSWEKIKSPMSVKSIIKDIISIKTPHYTGEIIKLESPYWPWFQASSFEPV